MTLGLPHGSTGAELNEGNVAGWSLALDALNRSHHTEKNVIGLCECCD